MDENEKKEPQEAPPEEPEKEELPEEPPPLPTLAISWDPGSSQIQCVCMNWGGLYEAAGFVAEELLRNPAKFQEIVRRGYMVSKQQGMTQ
jgi:hypothetical protein